jgi:homoserine kinase
MLDDKVLFHRIEPASNLQCVLLIPGYELATQKARAALPQKVPFKDAVFNLCRVPLVLANLAAGNLEDLSTLMDDRLHQPYRKELVREFDVIATEAENAGAAAVCLSGAGPTMLAIADKLRATAVANAMAAVLEPIDPACTSLIVTPDLDGCVIEIPGVNPANKS